MRTVVCIGHHFSPESVLGRYCVHFFDEVIVEDGRFDIRAIREGSDGGDYDESNFLIRGFPFGVLNRISKKRTLREKRLGNVGKNLNRRAGTNVFPVDSDDGGGAPLIEHISDDALQFSFAGDNGRGLE